MSLFVAPSGQVKFLLESRYSVSRLGGGDKSCSGHPTNRADGLLLRFADRSESNTQLRRRQLDKARLGNSLKGRPRGANRSQPDRSARQGQPSSDGALLEASDEWRVEHF